MPVWGQVVLVALGVVRELIRYLREHKQCSKKEQVKELKKLQKDIKLATALETDLNLKI